MMHDTHGDYTAPPAIQQMADLLRMRQAANPSQQQARSSFAHLSDPDLIRRLSITDIVIGDSGEDAEPVQPVKRTRKRKPTVTSVIREMKRAGIEIAGCEINPHDGTVRVITGKPSEATTATKQRRAPQEWDGVVLR